MKGFQTFISIIKLQKSGKIAANSLKLAFITLEITSIMIKIKMCKSMHMHQFGNSPLGKEFHFFHRNFRARFSKAENSGPNLAPDDVMSFLVAKNCTICFQW